MISDVRNELVRRLQSILGTNSVRSPSKWLEADLINLISTQEKESLTLDYKACDALAQSEGKKSELSKDVSAFANSAGGILVYGILENGHVPTQIDFGFDPSVISKEWLEQVINSRIQRRIDGVVVNQVDLNTTRPGKVAYVVVVPQSVRAPHQAFDKRFYKRFNFESVPMEEYEVRDTSRRSEAPDLSIRFGVNVSESADIQGQEPATSHFLSIEPIITNDSPTPANYVVINIFIDNRLVISGKNSGLKNKGGVVISWMGENYQCARLHINHAVPGKMPIFQGVDFSLLNEPIKVCVEAVGTYVIACELVAPGMQKKLFTSILSWNGIEATLNHI